GIELAEEVGDRGPEAPTPAGRRRRGRDGRGERDRDLRQAGRRRVDQRRAGCRAGGRAVRRDHGGPARHLGRGGEGGGDGSHQHRRGDRGGGCRPQNPHSPAEPSTHLTSATSAGARAARAIPVTAWVRISLACMTPSWRPSAVSYFTPAYTTTARKLAPITARSSPTRRSNTGFNALRSGHGPAASTTSAACIKCDHRLPKDRGPGRSRPFWDQAARGPVAVAVAERGFQCGF